MGGREIKDVFHEKRKNVTRISAQTRASSKVTLSHDNMNFKGAACCSYANVLQVLVWLLQHPHTITLFSTVSVLINNSQQCQLSRFQFSIVELDFYSSVCKNTNKILKEGKAEKGFFLVDISFLFFWQRIVHFLYDFC